MEVFIVVDGDSGEILYFSVEESSGHLSSDMLDIFFRINRGFILSLLCIDSAVVNGGRYTVEVHPAPGASTVVTRSRESEFLRWLEKS